MRLPNLFPRRDLSLTLTYHGQTLRMCETRMLGTERLVLGRTGADWALPAEDTLVSHRHAELFLRRGRWHIRDLSSRNGVWLFGERLTGERPLAFGDVYLLGECRLTVSLPGPCAASVQGSAHHMLQRLGGPRSGERLPLAAFPMTVGTGEACALRLSDTLASHLHAELLERTPEEGEAPGVFLRDLGSTNGTTVNGVPQKPEMNARLLSDGDTLAFASETFRFLDRAVPHEDSKAGLRRGGVLGGIFVLTVGVFALLRLFIWKDAATWLNRAEALGNACRFPEAAEALEKARHARGAEALAEALETCAGRLERWGRQASAWQAYAAAWAAAAPDAVPHVEAAAPKGDAADWPSALSGAHRATQALERLALADGTLRRLLHQQTPLADADLATLRALPGLRLDVAALKAVGLGHGDAWLAAFRRSAQPASEAAAALQTLRGTPPPELPGRIAAVARAEALGGALAAEAVRWRRMAAWVKAAQAAMPERLAKALSGEEAVPVPPPDLPEAQALPYVTFREGQETRLRSARTLGEALRPVAEAWRGEAEPLAIARARAEGLAREWMSPGSAQTALLAFFAAPEAEARRLLPEWQACRARAQALLDAVEGLEGALAFVEEEAPDSELARKVRRAAEFVAEGRTLQGELLGHPTPEARLTAFLLFPETCDAAARAAFRAAPKGGAQ